MGKDGLSNCIIGPSIPNKFLSKEFGKKNWIEYDSQLVVAAAKDPSIIP